MNNTEKIINLINENNGIITSTQLTEAKIPRLYLKKFMDENIIVRIDRGIYGKPDIWEDEMYILQYKYSKGVFSHETALYIHGFTDRTPMEYIMTFPEGYNGKSLKSENVKVKKSIYGIYELGIVEKISPCRNKIRIYDLERTLCDILRGNNNCDIQIINQAMKKYASYKGRDISKLMDYAEILKVKSKVANYMEVLL
ncbi:type IV toxin-antitoxin system AbiEi family antitoxin domain-containing protein [Clostridium gasigenes]|uniref:Transcriptional regulator, AbiEi antitoxin, Type IV TA system n=1 Tax=Clostridium gasigenes TaxID=94869 RepID=A0A1H0W700_9CLOT|nr:type IV toxin-antitoxin system AbiEi family antitoxin domain-containing protein [Clostridium gasigenes]MBU3106961.1 type IV toxin-antitoxin system AbiEi family antitoxin domain-containing protein [Clostridium gasigenes]MBU3134383.1 type IV toxin-antitoxin system AbiEi family antitoxin domain-containing protein [Clostridium gasigenes]SDP86185.1 Transcriptional regulator, AbiEi antitoxin, Type IV TA system [Clostridium gasigenes]